MAAIESPDSNCQLCPRLAEFREDWRKKESNWFNSPVPTWGDPKGPLLIVGLAPGLRGANKTGRPFTGDYAGDLLYAALAKYGFSVGHYGASPDDGLKLVGCAVTNAVRCVPPQNKPIGSEINTCRRFLSQALQHRAVLKAILVLGRIAHESTLKALGHRLKDFPFSHGAKHAVSDEFILYDSYHCSRYNTNTGRLTEGMFFSVISQIRQDLMRMPRPS